MLSEEIGQNIAQFIEVRIQENRLSVILVN